MLWKDILPIDRPEYIERITIGETQTPLVKSSKIGVGAGVDALFFKMEMGPTQSLKDRGTSLCALKALELGFDTLCVASSGNNAASVSAYAAKAGDAWFVAVDGKTRKPYDEIAAGTPIFSPDSKRLAYAARAGNRWLLVLDGKEANKYDSIGQCSPGQSSLVFSPDSRRVAYAANLDNKWFPVVDGQQGNQYDTIINVGGGKIVFDSPNRLHYLALRGNGIYLVEETIR